MQKNKRKKKEKPKKWSNKLIIKCREQKIKKKQKEGKIFQVRFYLNYISIFSEKEK